MILVRDPILLVAVLLIVQVYCQSRGGCPEKNGRFASPSQCDGYTECVDGEAEEKLCPDGLLFNPKAKFFTFPCQYPVDVDCEGRSGLQPPQATDECPHQFGYYALGDSSNCGQFLNCVDGRGYTFDCPEGLAWSQDTYRCDWPDQVESCNAEAFLGFTCPPQDEGVFTDEFRFYSHPNDCQRYIICVSGRPRLFNCGEDHAFNDNIGGCDGIENVTSCHNAGAGVRQAPGQQQQRPGQQKFQQQPLQNKRRY